MNSSDCTVDRFIQAQIDRLVCGELLEPERRSLLAWLDEDARRWRVCAVAFLEAQSWEQAAGELTPNRSVGEEPTVQAARKTPQVMPSAQQSALRILAIAASVAIVFAAGIFAARYVPFSGANAGRDMISLVRDAEGPSIPQQPLVATVTVRTNLDPGIPAQVQLPVTPTSGGQTAALSLSDYEREQWERSGFEVHEERRYLPARLQDGREVIVPVNKIQLKLKPVPVS
jgi:hypothetical protein